MNLFYEVTRRPWVADDGTAEDRGGRDTSSLGTAWLGLRWFFGVVTVLFLLLSLAYGERMVAVEWRPLPESWLLWLNTAMLTLGSAAFQWARVGARGGRFDRVKTGLLAGGVLTIAFLAGQLLAWQQLDSWNYYAPTNPANAFFYLITGLHGLHLVGGLMVWGRAMARVARGIWVYPVHQSVELCTAYWHFLLVVWLAMLGLLFFPGGALPFICRALIL